MYHTLSDLPSVQAMQGNVLEQKEDEEDDIETIYSHNANNTMPEAIRLYTNLPDTDGLSRLRRPRELSRDTVERRSRG